MYIVYYCLQKDFYSSLFNRCWKFSLRENSEQNMVYFRYESCCRNDQDIHVAKELNHWKKNKGQMIICYRINILQ